MVTNSIRTKRLILNLTQFDVAAHMFEQRGQLFRDGKTLRVRISYFEEWRDRIDGDTKRAQIVERRFSGTSQKRARTA